MKRWGKVTLGLGALVAALYAFGPYEKVYPEQRFDPAVLAGGVDSYLAQREAAVEGIRPDSGKRVIWAGAPEKQTDWAVVYLHGFSASSQEVRPVPDRIAAALGANLVYTRFRGHGRTSAAMGEARATDWLFETEEAMAIGRKVGKKVLLMGTSTGGSLAVLAAADPEMRQDLAGVVLISPNFAVNNPAAPLLTLPGARYWLPLILGQERSFKPSNDSQAREWTTSYPSVAVFPMAAVAQAARRAEHGQITVPTLFFFADEDQVVRADVTREIAADWGGPVEIRHPDLQAGDDDHAHVILGAIKSPGATKAGIEEILNWIWGL